MTLPVQVFILGLLTVFLVLLVVAGTGNAIIWVVNRHFSPPVKGTASIEDTRAVKAEHIAVITAAVQTATKGKGKVNKIEKLP